jgi:hypothetical protein
MVENERRFALLAGFTVAVGGEADAVRHFEAEYGPSTKGSSAGEPEVVVEFGPIKDAPPGPTLSGGHKTVRWQVALTSPSTRPLGATIQLVGIPRRFGLSLVQGYVVEPIISVAAARRQQVLLPAAAVVDEAGGALVLMGASGTGKSSLSARALAAGRPILGDDQVFVDAQGLCRRFPRRLRFYSDLRTTAPEAYRRLPPGSRLGLVARRIVKTVSRGLVAPSLAVSVGDLGPPPPTTALPIRRVILLGRGASGSSIQAGAGDLAAALVEAERLLLAQRRHIAAAGDPEWDGALELTSTTEREILRSAFRDVAIESMRVPTSWTAAHSVEQLSRQLQLSAAELS